MSSLVPVSGIHFQSSFSHLLRVVMFRRSISARGCLIQSCAVFDVYALILKSFFHLLSFFEHFFATRTTVPQILFAKAFDFRRSGTSIYLNLIAKALQLFCESHSIDGSCVLLA